MTFGGVCITWPVLFPVNATGGGGEMGLDIISFSNVQDGPRYYAQAIVAWVFFGWVMFVIGRETIYLAKVRTAYALTTWTASRISQRTVLFTNVPQDHLSLESLHTLFPRAAQITLVPDVDDDLADNVEELEKTVPKLEASEIKWMQAVTKKQQKNKGDADLSQEKKLRPTHRLKPLIGKKVDSINQYTHEITELLPKIQRAQQTHLQSGDKLLSAVIVEFETLAAAQSAAEHNERRRPKSLPATRQMGVMPQEIIWKNLKIGEKSRSLRKILVTIAIWLLIIFWSIPVAVVGSISNVPYLTERVPFLRFINNIPPKILGVVTGLLPTVALAVLMALVPVICRCKFLTNTPTVFDRLANDVVVFAKLGGAVTLTQVELQTQKWYFAFQVIQVFLVTTFTSSASAVVGQIIDQPAMAPGLLSKNLPKASNFYIAYFILFGVANASLYLFSPMGLVGALILSKFDKTPRKKYMRWTTFTQPSWGSEYPKWTNMGVIAIAYAVISPLVLGFATVGMGLIYLAYRYNMLYVYNTQIDTKGAFYAKALQQLMVGVYLAEFCILGLLGIGIGSTLSAIGPTVIMAVLVVVTIAFHVLVKMKLTPEVNHLPLEDTSTSDHANRSSRHSEQGLVPDAPSNGEKLQFTHDRTGPITTNLDAPGKEPLYKKIFTPRQPTVGQISASLAPHFRHPVPTLTKEEATEAYVHPALNPQNPVIWLAQDHAGIGRKECEGLTRSVGEYGVEVTDRGAVMNEKGKVEWVERVTEAPLWERKVVY